MALDTIERSFRVPMPDGRKLCGAEYGAAEGYPVLYCHGYPASHIEAQLADADAARLGVRLIVPDRPGYGESDPVAWPNFLTWADDVAVLADHLGLARFAVMGVSGGTPYALATASALPQRISRLAIVCGLGELHEADSERGMAVGARFMMRQARRSPAFAAAIIRYLLAPVVRVNPMVTLRMILSNAPPTDRAVLTDPAIQPILLSNYRHALLRSTAGAAQDIRLYTQPWNINYGAITAPTDVWHGTADSTVPFRVGEAYAQSIAGSTLHALEGEGHFSAIIRKMPDILSAAIRT